MPPAPPLPRQGFVRLALEEGAWLVPVLAIGETLQVRRWSERVWLLQHTRAPAVPFSPPSLRPANSATSPPLLLQLANLISAPELQRATYKRLGFPVPFILAGRWGRKKFVIGTGAWGQVACARSCVRVRSPQ